MCHQQPGLRRRAVCSVSELPLLEFHQRGWRSQCLFGLCWYCQTDHLRRCHFVAAGRWYSRKALLRLLLFRSAVCLCCQTSSGLLLQALRLYFRTTLHPAAAMSLGPPQTDFQLPFHFAACYRLYSSLGHQTGFRRSVACCLGLPCFQTSSRRVSAAGFRRDPLPLRVGM
jgi:hypothetical protein